MKINKLVGSLVASLVVVSALNFSNNSVLATGGHQGSTCGTFEYTFNHDGSNDKVEVDFEDSDKQIDVEGKNGWSVTKVLLDVEDDNHFGYWQYSTGPLNNFNPNPGKDINSAKVTVFKPCPTARPSATATPVVTQAPSQAPTQAPTMTATPVQTYQPTSTPTVTNTPNASSTPIATATATPNSDVCPNLDGVQTSLPTDYHFDNDGINCLKFELGGPPQSSSEPAGIGGGMVLGASTMASAGSFSDAFFNSIFTLGSLLTSLGIMKNAKKKN